MALLRKDSATANKHNTAVCVEDESSDLRSFGDFPDYVAVPGDALDHTAALLLKQKQSISKKIVIKTAALLGIGMILILRFMPPADHLPAAAILALLTTTVLISTTGSIDPEGVEINDVVFNNLTDKDRDVLFRAHAEGPEVYRQTLDIITERYAAEERRLSREKDHGAHEMALALLGYKSTTNPESRP